MYYHLNNHENQFLAKLSEALSWIPKGVTTLHLSENAFVDEILAGAPQSFCSLYEELTEVFSGIPQTVTSLDFGNYFSSMTAIQVSIILSLPKCITRIIINGECYSPEEYLLLQLFPLSSHENYHDEISTIEPNFDIDERMLIKIVTYLQNHPSPMGYLVCGLLLQGKIVNSCNENIFNLRGYLDNRVMAAISFYRKAACDQALKPKIEYMLWHLRTVEKANERLQRVLKPFKLNPGMYVPTYAGFRAEERGQDFEDHSLQPINIDQILIGSLITPQLIFKIGLSTTLGAAAIILLYSKVPAIIAYTGIGMVGALTFASCRLLVNAEQRNIDLRSAAGRMAEHVGGKLGTQMGLVFFKRPQARNDDNLDLDFMAPRLSGPY